MEASNPTDLTRRQFVKTTAVAVAAAGAFPHFARGGQPDKPLTIGLVGCGGRGSGAAVDAMNADPNVKVVAVAEIAEDRLKWGLEQLNKKKQVEIDAKYCFVGFDAYKKVLDTAVDYVILATPPYYRPEHLEACVAAGKHVFMEKPVAVDPVGVRRIIETGRKAKEKNLSIVAGTQRRHQNGYLETIKLIHEGAIGDIVAAQCYWIGGQARYHKREPGWSDSQWMHRDWFNWRWLSGDHIVEQHVHNLDVINWVIGTHPEKVLSMGGRARRVTGDQFDHFSSDFYYPNDVHLHSMCRQISGCTNEVSERVIGRQGVSNCNGWISKAGKLKFPENSPYVQEHKDLIQAIRTGQPINEAQNVAESTLCGIMARTSAYTGTMVTWEEMMKSDMVLGPPDYELTEENIRAHVPVPGKA